MAVNYCNKKFFTKIFILVFLLTIWSRCCDFVLAGELSLLDVKNKGWQIIADSGWPGASRGWVHKSKEGNHLRELSYQFKATNKWPWPEIDFFIPLVKVADFSEFNWVKLDIQGEFGKEVYFYFLVKDQNLGKPKPLMSRFLLTGKRQNIYLPFANFKIASDWQPRNLGYSQSLEWNKVISFGLHAKGRDGQQGRIMLFEIKLLQNNPAGATDLAQMRSSPPRHFSIDLQGYSSREVQAEIIIDNSLRNKQKVPPYLFGANWGVWLNLPSERKVAALKLKILRAGGPFMDRYNWRNGKYTFPGNDRVISMTSLDEYIAYCRRIGAEPLIQINALGYAPEGKSGEKFSQCMGEQDAVDLLRYLNQKKGYNVKFFEIGNEPFIWHKVHFDVRKTPCSMDEYFSLFRKISIALKRTQNEINPNLKIKIMGPSFCLEDMQLSGVGDFLQKCNAFQNNHKENPQGIRILDVLSFHYFPSFDGYLTGQHPQNIATILGSTLSWWDASYSNKHDYHLPFGSNAEILPRLKKLIENNYAGTELALTEFNIEGESMVEYDPLIKVLYLADLYGIMAKYQLNYFTQFVLNSSDHYAALLDDLDNLTPLYYPFSLYSQYFQGSLLETRTTLPEKLNVYACNNNGSIIVMVINKTSQPYFTGLQLKSNNSKISFAHIFPAFSLTCIEIKEHQKRKLAQCWEYGEQQINRIVGK
jgi:hypothetical protein